jgi:SulP family sulfate permease
MTLSQCDRNRSNSPVILKLAIALRKSISAGYDSKTFLADLMAGLIVGMIAIPLGMSLAISTGLPPQFGLYTIIVVGALTAILGGSNCQVTGPTAAFIVVLVPIVQQYGLSGLLTAGLMAGFILIAMGLLRMGKLIEFIPHPVITGFTSGIALVIFTIQLKDFLAFHSAFNQHISTKDLLFLFSTSRLFL